MKISRFLFTLIVLCCSIMQSLAVIRNGYNYTVTQKPGVMVEYQATQTGRVSSLYGDTWYATTSFWYENGLPCSLKALDVTPDIVDWTKRLVATGENLTDIKKFDFRGLETAVIGSQASNPVRCYIRLGAFRNSKKLTSLTLTSAVAGIELYAFEGMTNGEIICEGKTPPLLAFAAFSEEGYKNIKVYVPDDCVNKYKSSSWGRFHIILPIRERNLTFYFHPIQYEVGVGSTVKLHLSDFILPENLTWSSSDEEIVTVSDGVVKGIKPGQAVVTATHLSGSEAACRVTVIPQVEDIKFNVENFVTINGAINITTGDSQKLPISIFPSGATGQLIWRSSEPNIVDIDQDGVFSALKEGKSTISVIAESGVCASINIVVNPAAKSLTLDRQEWYGSPGESIILQASILPITPLNQTVTWNSSDERVAIVDEEGKVTAVNPGNAFISATTSNGLSATCSVSVCQTIDGVKYVIDSKDGVNIAKAVGFTPDLQSSITLPSEIDFNGHVFPLKEIAKDAFKGCTSLTSISINKSITLISDQAFYDCLGLKHLHVGEGLESLLFGKKVFYNCPIEELYQGRDITYNDNPPFKDNLSLINVALGDNVTWIRDRYFDGCNNLITVSIGNKVSSIGGSAFRNCSKLTSVEIPNSVTSIGEESFSGCYNLSSISFMGNPQLNSNVFLNCEQLSTIICHGEDPIEGAYTAFDGVYGKATLYVPLGCKSIYKLFTPWKNFINIKEIGAVEIDSISFDYEALTLKVDEVFKLLVTILPDDSTYKTVSWTSSDLEVATVDENGTVKAVNVGECIVTATATDGSDVSAQCKIIVNPILIESITLDRSEWNCKVDDSFTLTATVLPENATDKSISWTSNDPDVATVDENGNVTAINVGECSVTAYAADGSGVSASCKVTVLPRQVESIELDRSEWNGMPGESFVISVTLSPDNVTDKTIVWNSSDQEIATVDEAGLVTAISTGSAIITATTSNNLTATCVVTVLPVLVEEIILSPSEVQGVIGDSFTIGATILPKNASEPKIEWESTRPRVATVNQEGYVEIHEEGTCRIIALATDGSDVSAECIITGVSGIESVFANGSERIYVYTPEGILIKKDCSSDDLKNLVPGIYILKSETKTITVILR
ncbi:MAG: leucine-rich repeat protein [Bacteroidales bacterium]|nr:leucine-rich repeat protein [Bacteroidales bacterium]